MELIERLRHESTNFGGVQSHVSELLTAAATELTTLTARVEAAEWDARACAAALARAIPHLPTQSLRDQFAADLFADAAIDAMAPAAAQVGE